MNRHPLHQENIARAVRFSARLAHNPILRNVLGTAYTSYQSNEMAPHRGTRSGSRRNDPRNVVPTTPRSRSLSHGSYNAPSDVRTQSANNASDLIDQYHPESILKTKATHHKKSKKQKRASKKKAAFKKKVEKIIHKLDAPVILTEYTSVSKNLSAWPSIWANDPRQAITDSESISNNQILRIWCGGATATGAPLTQVLDIQEFSTMLSNVGTDVFAPNTVPDGQLTSQTGAGWRVKKANALKMQFWVARYEYNLSLYNGSIIAGNITPGVACTYDILEYVAARTMCSGDPYNTVDRAMTQCISEISTPTSNLGVPTATVMSGPLLRLGQTPSMIPGFSKHWKLEQSTRIFLQPGESTCLTIHGPTGWYDQQKYSSITSIKGHTKEIVIISGAAIAYGAQSGIVSGLINVTKTIKARFPSEFGLSPLIPLSMLLPLT